MGMPGLFSRLMGVDADNAARAAEADAIRARLNQEKFERGEWDAAQYQAVQANWAASQFDPDQQTYEAAYEGLKEGAENIQGTVKGSLNAAGGFVWGSLPWWVLPLAAVALFLYMGGGQMLKGSLNK
jgi:hypothetical protein